MKLPNIPSFVLSTPIKVYNKESLSGDGQAVRTLDFDGKGRKEKYTSKNYKLDGDTNVYSWVIYLNEDHGTVDGSVDVGGESFIIGKIDKHLNPDGTYNHTKLYLT